MVDISSKIIGGKTFFLLVSSIDETKARDIANYYRFSNKWRRLARVLKSGIRWYVWVNPNEVKQ